MTLTDLNQGVAGWLDGLPRIVSVDDHVVEPSHVWQRWLPERFREQGPRVERMTVAKTYDAGTVRFAPATEGFTTDVWVYEDLVRPIPQVMACAGFPPESLTTDPIAFDEMRPGCFDVKARLADMDANHTEASLCFPTFPRFCGQTFLEAKDRELAHACVEANNDWMIEEWCGESGGRLLPLCLVPLWDPVAAAAEVRRNAARGARAVAFTELPSYLGLPSIHARDGHWNPFLEACDETGTVVCMHIGSGSRMPTSSADAPPGVGVALTFMNAQVSMADWLMSGALARYPNLKLAYSEGQIGWMPFLLERCDNIFKKSRGWIDLDPAIVEPPSTYAKGRVFGCFFDDDFGLSARDAIGIDQITFETDYPHQDSTWPHSGAMVAAFAERLSPVELEKIVRGNARAMLGLTG